MDTNTALERLSSIIEHTAVHDPRLLAKAHETLSDIALWATNTGQVELAQASYGTASVVQDILLGEVPDPHASIRGVKRLCGFMHESITGKTPFLRTAHAHLQRPAPSQAAQSTGEAAPEPMKIDIAPDVLEDFIARAEEHLFAANMRFLKLESFSDDPEALDPAFRTVDMLRRSASALRLHHIAHGARLLSTLVEKARTGDVALEAALLDVAFDVLAVLQAQLTALGEASGTPVSLTAAEMYPRPVTELHQAMEDPDTWIMSQGETYSPTVTRKRLGEILIESGTANEEAVREALRLQATAESKKLGEVLLERGMLAPSQLQDALSLIEQNPDLGQLGEVLVQLGAVSEAGIAAALREQAQPGKPRLGELLVQSAVIPAKDVARALRAQRLAAEYEAFGLSLEAAQDRQPDQPTANPALIKEFIQGTRENLDAADAHLLSLEYEPENHTELGAVHRRFRAVKRVAESLRFAGIAACARETELLLGRICKGELPSEGASFDLAFDAVEEIRQQIQRLEGAFATSQAPEPSDSGIELASRIRAFAHGDPSVAPTPEKLPFWPDLRLGELLIDQGVLTRDEVDAALQEQAAGENRRPLGQILLEQAKISRKDLEDAVEYQQKHPDAGRLGDVLVSMGRVQPADVEAALSAQREAGKTRLGEVLIRSRRAQPKAVAQAVRSQDALKEFIRFGFSSLARLHSNPEGQQSDPDPPHDVNRLIQKGDPDVLRAFVERTRRHLEAADINLLEVESSTDALHAITHAYRSIRAIRRISGFLSLTYFRDFAYEAEYLLNKARLGTLRLEGPELDLAFDAVEVLRRHTGYISEALDSGKPLTPDPALQGLTNRLRQAARGDIEPLVRVWEVSSKGEARVGDILIASGLLTPEALEEALREQESIPAIHRRLGDILVERVNVSQAQLDEALNLQHAEGGRAKLGDILVRMGVVDEADITAALAIQQRPEKPKLGEILVRTGRVSAKAVAQAIRSQRALRSMVRAGATAAVATAVLMGNPVQASAGTQVAGAGGSVMVQVSMDSSPDATSTSVDSDQDGLYDNVEAKLGTNPQSADSDQDGMPDRWEVEHGLDPLSPDDAAGDLDQDGLTNLEEYEYGTSPHEVDSDQDDWWDSAEVDRGTDPLSSASYPDSDLLGDVNADGAVNALDVQAVINTALGMEMPFPTDVNKVGGVNALDVQIVINQALEV